MKFSSREIDRSHPYYGPDSYAVHRHENRERPYRSYGEKEELRDQPLFRSQLEPQGFWDNLRDFFGVGPRGYQRSDEAVYEDVCEALAHHPEIDASRIEVNVEDGVVTLTGEVPSREMKFEAEDTVEWLRGVARVKSALRVSARRAG